MAGQVYHITTATLDWQPVFADLHSARCLILAMREAQNRGEAMTLAFVVMPDHLHWLLQLGVGRSLAQVVGTVKAVTSHGLGNRLWQGGFHDHALRRDEELVDTARYVVANPLLAGLVERLGDYPHWDAMWL